MTRELVIVGSGIKAVAQMTREAQEEVKRANKLLYLVAEPFTAGYVTDLNASSESLLSSYVVGKPRRLAYDRMVQRILECLEVTDVCVLFYGHPTTLVAPAVAALERAQARGYRTRVVPGISAEDCLIADLVIDPGVRGMQSYEATDFLLYPKTFDTSVPMVLWQVGVLGDLLYSPCGSEPPLSLLGERLEPHYGGRHEVILYTAASHPAFKPDLVSCALEALVSARVTGATTMFVPPSSRPRPDADMHARLGVRVREA